jgi:cytochrome c oxidase assembly protein subunit 15
MTTIASFPRRSFARVAAAAVLLALVVVVFGAFVRLSNAGLSCPDWPLCYGQITWPSHATEIARANAAFPERPVESHKAWREQVHRFIAGGLIVVTFTLAVWGWRRRRQPDVPWRAALAAAALIVFQALLGMWTVTWKLKPVVVMAHLLGGMTTLALLVWIACRAAGSSATGMRRGAIAGAIAVLALQVALGGWVSANYAALACGMQFPQCLGQWWPPADFGEGFVLWRGIGVDYEGGVLDGPARTAIQLAHRAFALPVAAYLLVLGLVALRRRGWAAYGAALLAMLAAQVALGIGNVLIGLPLPVATAHNAGAAVLLAILVAMLARAAPNDGRAPPPDAP